MFDGNKFLYVASPEALAFRGSLGGEKSPTIDMSLVVDLSVIRCFVNPVKPLAKSS